MSGSGIHRFYLRNSVGILHNGVKELSVGGCWEFRQANQVLTAIINTECTTVKWGLGVRRLILPGPEPLDVQGLPFDHARNSACQALLGSPCQWLFFLDSDVVPPRDAVLRLMSHNAPIISGLYCRRSPPVGVPVMMRPVGQWLTNYAPGSVVDVDVVGAGCLLIHRSVIERMPPQRPKAGKTWFDWRVDCAGVLPAGECLSEDFCFCIWAKKTLGVKILVDTSIVCGHIGFSDSRIGRFDPLGSLPIP
jgi:hypothetical protein